MNAWVTKTVIVLAVVTGFTVNAEAQTVVPDTGNTLHITTTVSAVGVLASK